MKLCYELISVNFAEGILEKNGSGRDVNLQRGLKVRKWTQTKGRGRSEEEEEVDSPRTGMERAKVKREANEVDVEEGKL